MVKARIFILLFFIIALLLYIVGIAIPIFKLNTTIPITSPNATGTPLPTNLLLITNSKFYIDRVNTSITDTSTGKTVNTEEKYSNNKIFTAVLYTSIFSILLVAFGIVLLFLNLKLFAKIFLAIGILGMVSMTILLTLFITDNSMVNVIKDMLNNIQPGLNKKLDVDNGYILITTGSLLALVNYFVFTFL